MFSLYLIKNWGAPDDSVVERLPSAPVMISGSWDRVPHGLPTRSLLLPLPVSLPLSLSVSLRNPYIHIFKKFFKHTKKLETSYSEHSYSPPKFYSVWHSVLYHMSICPSTALRPCWIRYEQHGLQPPRRWALGAPGPLTRAQRPPDGIGSGR